MASNPFFTIGHSTRSIEAFIALLREVEVWNVIDVRTVPRSRTNPQFNRDVLPVSLAQFQIGYEHLAALGGLRGVQRDISPEINAFWENASFHNFADYAMGKDFHSGLERLREVGRSARSVVMCAEAVWWRCHRRIIADYLIAAGEEVFHIMGEAHVEPARMTLAARPQPGGTVTYPKQPPSSRVARQ
jgi:uncharacterized protein (DUF488 family)